MELIFILSLFGNAWLLYHYEIKRKRLESAETGVSAWKAAAEHWQKEAIKTKPTKTKAKKYTDL